MRRILKRQVCFDSWKTETGFWAFPASNRYVNYLAGVLPEGRILAGYCGFDANISFTFQAVKNLFAHPTYLFSAGLFCKCFGDFWIYLEIWCCFKIRI